jgi:hypothetical protein
MGSMGRGMRYEVLIGGEWERRIVVPLVDLSVFVLLHIN